MKKKKEKRGFNYKNYIGFIVFIGILFASIYIFTKPAFISGFDLSNKGAIGDTIGGITAPIINLLGAVLVYMSFQAQINANKIQSDLLKTEVENQRYDRNFSVTIDLINSLKEDFKSLYFNNNQGLFAINSYVNGINENWDKDQFRSYMRKPIYNEWKFLIFELDLILNHVTSSELREDEKEKLKEITKVYYITSLKLTTKVLLKYLEKFSLENKLTNTINGFPNYNFIT